jgi:HTH-type transcriptional regulator / antitoxin HipB
MDYSVAHWVEQLKLARKRKGLTQAELGKKVGLPQSYVSKVEGGSIDIRLSSLLELARALELEPILVPRSLVPAVQSLTRTRTTVRPETGELSVQGHSPTVIVRPAYALDEDDADG